MARHIPNILTIIRLILVVPILVLFYFTSNSPDIHLIIVVLTGIATISDFLDGFIARKYDLISDFGTIHDPLADKWLTVLYIPLMSLGMIHFIPVSLLWLRDITSTHLRIMTDKPMPARLSGKVKTAISFPLMCLMILAMPVENNYFKFFTRLDGPLYWIGGIVLSLACIWSGVDYYYQVMIKKSYS